jgi:hypothetical protein
MGVCPWIWCPRRFFDELGRIRPFQRHGQHDPAIQKAHLPPKQAFLPGLFLFNHAAGYRLPEWEHFLRYYVAAVQKHKSYEKKFARCFTAEGEPLPGMLWRMSGWYEDSMAHAFLYTVLVLAYEDLDQSAFVLYDARADWKFKADFIITRSASEAVTGVRVGIQGQNEEDRAKMEAERDLQERDTKRNTLVSSHWNNETYQTLPSIHVSRVDGAPIIKHGFKLFSVDAMERLMLDVDKALGQPRRSPMTVERMLAYRPGSAS